MAFVVEKAIELTDGGQGPGHGSWQGRRWHRKSGQPKLRRPPGSAVGSASLLIFLLLISCPVDGMPGRKYCRLRPRSARSGKSLDLSPWVVSEGGLWNRGG